MKKMAKEEESELDVRTNSENGREAKGRKKKTSGRNLTKKFR